MSHTVFEKKFFEAVVTRKDFPSGDMLKDYLNNHPGRPQGPEQRINLDQNNNFWTRLGNYLDLNRSLVVIICGSMFVIDEMDQFVTDPEEELNVERDVILVIGDPIGLERELVLDIAFACKRTGLSDSLSERILTSVCTGEETGRVHRYLEDTGRLQVISNPSMQSFEELFVDAIRRVTARQSVEIIYCGHGGDDGSIAFHDGDYSLKDFSALLQNNALHHSPQLRLLLNCCFASKLVGELMQGENDEFNSGDQSYDPTFGSSQSAFGSGEAAFGSGQSVVGSGQSAFGSGQSAFGSGQSAFGSGQSVLGSGRSVSGSGQSVLGSGQSVLGSDEAAFGSGQSAFGSGQSVFGSGQSVLGSGRSESGSGQSAFVSGQSVFGSGQSAFGSGQSVFGAGQSVLGSGRSVSGSGQSAFGSSRSAFGSSRSAFGSDEAAFDTIEAVLDPVLDLLVDFMKVKPNCSGIVDLARQLKSGSLSEIEFQSVQSKIIGLIFLLIDASGGRSLKPYSWGHNNLNIWPLSFGLLRAEGFLGEYCGQPLMSIANSRVNRVKMKYKEKKSWFEDVVLCNTHMPVPRTRHRSILSSPRVTVFCAGFGDSCLLEWQNFKILIDGGGTSASRTTPFTPCYWEKVKHFPSLYVVLTHGDMDHVGGLLPLFGRQQHAAISYPKIEGAMFIAPASAVRSWRHVKLLGKYAKGANIPVMENMHSGREKIFGTYKGCTIRLHVLHPSAVGMKVAQDLGHAATSYRGLSKINKLGLVFVIECISAAPARVWRLLFTGDACGKDIANALESCSDGNGKKWSSHVFDYSDMPHHGSKNNKPGVFLNKLNTKRLVVSTNGEGHRHPDHETCLTLDAWMKTRKTTQLYFNYENHARKNGVPRVQDTFAADVMQRVTFHSDGGKPLVLALD